MMQCEFGAQDCFVYFREECSILMDSSSSLNRETMHDCLALSVVQLLLGNSFFFLVESSIATFDAKD